MTTRSDMLFDAEASARYHRKRAAFLESANFGLTLLMVVAGSGAVVTLVTKTSIVAAIVAVPVAIAGAIKHIYKPDHCAVRHNDWLKRWSAILSEVKTTPKPTAEQINDWVRRKHEIEAECVGEMNALKADCWNRTARAQEREGEPYRLRWYHRRLMHVIRFDQAFEDQEKP